MQSFINTKESIFQRIAQISEEFLAEVLDFLQFLKSKHLQANLEASALSESSLQKNWFRPEEEAWQDL